MPIRSSGFCAAATEATSKTPAKHFLSINLSSFYSSTRFGGREVLVFLGEAHDQRYVRALFPDGVFASWHAHTVVGPDDDDRIVPQPVLFKLGDEFTGPVVDLRDRVVVT